MVPINDFIITGLRLFAVTLTTGLRLIVVTLTNLVNLFPAIFLPFVWIFTIIDADRPFQERLILTKVKVIVNALVWVGPIEVYICVKVKFAASLSNFVPKISFHVDLVDNKLQLSLDDASFVLSSLNERVFLWWNKILLNPSSLQDGVENEIQLNYNDNQKDDSKDQAFLKNFVNLNSDRWCVLTIFLRRVFGNSLVRILWLIRFCSGVATSRRFPICQL